MSENISHSLGGFRGAFESEYGRKPTEQEIWNAAISSWRDLTRQKSDAVKEQVVEDLLMYAGDNGYSHIDYADTMRHAAALLQSTADHIPDAGKMVDAMPVGELTDEQIDALQKKHLVIGVNYNIRMAGLSGVHEFARAILAAASPPPVREPLTNRQINDMMHKEPLLNYKFMLNGGQGPCCKEGVEIVRAVERAHGIK